MAELQAEFELLPRDTLDAEFSLEPRANMEATFEINIATKGDKGEKGDTGPAGKDATINGINTVELDTEYGITYTQTGNKITISGKEITDVVDGISAVIPPQASEQNPLADRKYVQDSLPTVNNATLTIQENGTQVAQFTANSNTNTTANIIVPTKASDVGALPDTTKYGASLSLSINQTTYVMTMQLKDQNGNNLGSSQTVDLPLESVVVGASYDSVNKKIVLTLQNGSTIDVPVGDLVAGLQTEITEQNKLSSDLVDDTNKTNKFVTAQEKTTWNGKQDAITGAATTITDNNLTTNRVVVSDGNGKVAVSSTTATEVGYLSGVTSGVQGQLNLKASTSLDNLSANGQMIVDSQNGTISNCILDIPQDINLTLSNGTLTLKSGSVLTKPDGTQVTTTSDTTGTRPNNGTFVVTSRGYGFVFMPPEQCYSGATAPTLTTSFALWFDTTNLDLKYTTNTGSTWTGGFYLPYGIVTVTDGAISSIDQVFNGAGYIGHHAFVLPGVKYLIADGLNPDGTLKSISRTKTNLSILELPTYNSNNRKIFLDTWMNIGNQMYKPEVDTFDEIVQENWYLQYVKSDNYYYQYVSDVLYTRSNVPFVSFETSTSGITKFDIRQPVRMATTDMLDSALSGYATQQWVVGQGYLTGITSSMITTALGYTPYNATNFVGTDGSDDGEAGLVPAPVAIDYGSVLKADGTWGTIDYSEISNTPSIPTSADYWTVGTQGVSNYQTTYSKKTIYYTASGAQDNGLKVLASSDTAPSSTVGAWSGRCLFGNEKRTFLLGTARNSASGSQSICGIGAHTWGSATSQTSAAWDNFYLNPDGSTAVYIGGNGWRGSSGWLRVQNNNSGGALYRVAINTGTNSSPSWKTVLPNNATGTSSILFTPTVSTTFSYTYATAVNGTVTANYGTAFGYGTSAAGSATALGYNAKATGSGSIQIGQGTNSTANTLSVGLSSSLNVQLLDSAGVIPAGRLNIASSVSSASTNSQMVGAKLFYDTVGNIETALQNINSGS